jgi:16S rRNA (uracil1498-N3)-methyltransferase
MPRIYLPASDIKDNQISITDEKAHYLTSVLRCRKGDVLIIFDGKGNCLRTKILKADRREVITEVIERFLCNTESHINITLVQGFLKGEKMDMVIQKTTELGVKEIIPLITERSQLRETRKVARWRKIAEEASRQSGRSVIPVVHEPVEFKKFFSKQTFINYPPQSPLTKGGIKKAGFIFYEEGGMKLSKAVLRIRIHDTGYRMQDKENHASCIMHHASLPFFVFIGSEGGFTREEVALAEEKGLIVTSLGKRILRAETAAISAVTLVQFLLGDMS